MIVLNGGVKMKLNGVEYENPEAILEVRQYSDKRNKLIQDLYKHYVSLRYIARGNGCNKASFSVVYDELQKEDVFKEVQSVFNYDKEEMNRRLELCRKYIPMID